MSDILIRPTSLPLASLLASMHTESFGAECWSIDQMRGSLMLNTTQGWIAFDDTHPAGFILCQTVPEEIEILTFAVRPSHRRQGIGQKLLRHVIATAPQTCQKIFLEVAADNDTARKLYEQSGFHLTGTRPNYYRRGATMVDALTYQMAVGRDQVSDY